MSKQQDKLSCLPALSPIELQILVSLLTGDRHGLGIIQEVARRTNQELFLSTATLYTALKRLSQAELIQVSEEAPPAKDGNAERRRYYRLSEVGVEAVVDEVVRLEHLTRQVRHILKERSIAEENPPSSNETQSTLTQTQQSGQKNKKANDEVDVRPKHSKLVVTMK